jgi:hypothetical protein
MSERQRKARAILIGGFRDYCSLRSTATGQNHHRRRGGRRIKGGKSLS